MSYTCIPLISLPNLFRVSEDGTPAVEFPRNFDRVVGLMDRNDLLQSSAEGVSDSAIGHGGRGSKAAGSNRDRYMSHALYSAQSPESGG